MIDMLPRCTTRSLLLLAVLVLFAPLRAWADSASDQPLPPLPDAFDLPMPELKPVAPAESSHKWLKHEIALDASIWPGELPEGVDPVWIELSYRPRLAGELGAGFAITAEALLRASQGKRAFHYAAKGDGNAVRLSRGSFHGNADREAVLVKEAQLSWAGHGVEVIAGYQILSWGKADGVRPLDEFRTQDLSDPLRAETLGLPGLSASYGSRGFSIEGIWVPFAFNNRLATHPANAYSIVPRIPGARFHGTRRELDWHDGEFGFRAAYSGQAWDVALQASRTRDRSPSLLRVAPDPAHAEIAVTPDYLRHYTYGASLVRAIDRYLLKADFAYADYSVEHAPLIHDGFRLVTGAEARGQLAASGSYTVILEYALDTTTPGKIVQQAELISSPYHWFRHALVGSALLNVSPRFDAELKALVDLQHGSVVASATLSYHPNDSTSLFCQGDFVTGPDETWLGRLEFADRIVVGVIFNSET